MLKLVSVGKDQWMFENDPEQALAEFDCIDLAAEAYHSGKVELAVEMLRQWLLEFPDSIEACNTLGQIHESQNQNFDSYLVKREAVRIGLAAMPAKFNWKKSQLEWGFIENRPFMRAYYALGLELLDQKKLDEAAEVFERLLSVCPNDNIGARCVLPEVYFLQGNYRGVIELHSKYPDDMLPEVTFGAALATAMLCDLPKAKQMLAEAAERLPLVLKELKKKRHTRPKSVAEGMMTIGGADQAYAYWEDFGQFWQNEAGIQLLG